MPCLAQGIVLNNEESWDLDPRKWGSTTSESDTGVSRSAEPKSASATQAERRVIPISPPF